MVFRVHDMESFPQQFINFEFYEYESAFKLFFEQRKSKIIYIILSDQPNRDPQEGEKEAWIAQISARNLLFQCGVKSPRKNYKCCKVQVRTYRQGVDSGISTIAFICHPMERSMTGWAQLDTLRVLHQEKNSLLFFSLFYRYFGTVEPPIKCMRRGGFAVMKSTPIERTEILQAMSAAQRNGTPMLIAPRDFGGRRDC